MNNGMKLMSVADQMLGVFAKKRRHFRSMDKLVKAAPDQQLFVIVEHA